MEGLWAQTRHLFALVYHSFCMLRAIKVDELSRALSGTHNIAHTE
jgi:hypothetical protein